MGSRRPVVGLAGSPSAVVSSQALRPCWETRMLRTLCGPGLSHIPRTVSGVVTHSLNVSVSDPVTGQSRARCLWSRAGQAEAKEALEAVTNGELKDGKVLDRNRDGTMKLNFAIVSLKELEVVNKLLYHTFYPGDPLISHLGLCQGPNSLRDLDNRVEERLPMNVSIVAYDETGRPVGTAVNTVCYKGEIQYNLEDVLKGVEDPRFKPIEAIHHKLRRENDHVWEEIGIDKLFHIGMVGVLYKNQGIATNLIRRSILLAGCLGFRGIKTEATGDFSRHEYGMLGMLPSGSIKYADFEFEGQKVFGGLANPDTEITFMKKKFFQSSLKHIL